MSQAIKQALQKALSDGDEGVRQAAAVSLDALEGREHLDELLAQLKGDDRGQRIAAAYALERVSSTKIFIPLLEALKSQDSDLRAAVAQVLGGKRHPKTLGPLVKALADPEPGVQVEIIKALSGFSDRRIPACLEPLLKKGEEVSLAAIEALGVLGFAEGEKGLIQALEDQRPRVRRAAAEALGRLQS
ncbi:MAG: hypothetical protein C0619_03470 [Desulfuromonas sp.]|jgi:HEAT repeat protein|nr:MAG: hypothetical protein C0619_03470 [Desulfuromonas sp.]